MPENLKDTVEKLHRLLQDPHPGLMTWNEFVHARFKELATMLKEMGY